jgi:hypothetical protein
LVVMYPVYSCRRDVVVQARSVYNKVLVSHRQIVM